jgi:hypothetical protein
MKILFKFFIVAITISSSLVQNAKADCVTKLNATLGQRVKRISTPTLILAGSGLVTVAGAGMILKANADSNAKAVANQKAGIAESIPLEYGSMPVMLLLPGSIGLMTVGTKVIREGGFGGDKIDHEMEALLTEAEMYHVNDKEFKSFYKSVKKQYTGADQDKIAAYLREGNHHETLCNANGYVKKKALVSFMVDQLKSGRTPVEGIPIVEEAAAEAPNPQAQKNP